MSQALFICFAVLAIVLILLPLPLHWRAKNMGTLLFIGWVLVHLVSSVVNTSLWIDSVTVKAPIWCDISIKLSVGVAPGLTGASLCINRRLATIATNRSADLGRNHDRNALLFDFAIGIGAPCILMALSYVTQSHRANIGENIGCLAPIWPCIAQIVLGPIWPAAFSLVSSIYGVIAIRALILRRLQFSAFLRGSGSGLTPSRYLRLAALASCDLLIYLPLSIYQIVVECKDLQPWISWSNVHADFGYILTIPSSWWSAHAGEAVPAFLFRWSGVLFAFIFFLFFGVSEEALAEYSRWCETIGLRRFGSRTSADMLPMSKLPHLGSTVERSGGGAFLNKWVAGKGDDQEGYASGQDNVQKGLGIVVSIDRQTV